MGYDEAKMRNLVDRAVASNDPDFLKRMVLRYEELLQKIADLVGQPIPHLLYDTLVERLSKQDRQPLDLPRPQAPAGFWVDGKGRLVPEAAIKPADLLMDQLVRKQIGYAIPLRDEVGRFKGYCLDEVAVLRELIDQEYGVTRGGEKGNITLYTIDTLYKVVVQVSDYLSFGPELQSAKALVDECLLRWSEGSNAHLIAVVNQAFAVDKQGKINRTALFGLRRLHIDDDGWQRAMQALADSMRVVGSKEYIRHYRRASIDHPWEPITIDLAAVERQ